jgi:hypothetical protein
MEIKANNWYRTRGGDIAYVAAIAPFSHVNYPLYGWTAKETRSWTLDGKWMRGELSQPDLVEHLPDCNGFDWVPTPKIKLEFNGKYLQANGEVVGPISLLHSGEFCYYDIKLARVWNESGIRLNDDKRATENIVSEYVEPEPVYEPWDFDTMPDFVRVQSKTDGKRWTAFPISNDLCQRGTKWIDYKELFDHYTQLDGTPCGKRVQP